MCVSVGAGAIHHPHLRTKRMPPPGTSSQWHHEWAHDVPLQCLHLPPHTHPKGWATNPTVHAGGIPSSKGIHVRTPARTHSHIHSALMPCPLVVRSAAGLRAQAVLLFPHQQWRRAPSECSGLEMTECNARHRRPLAATKLPPPPVPPTNALDQQKLVTQTTWHWAPVVLHDHQPAVREAPPPPLCKHGGSVGPLFL